MKGARNIGAFLDENLAYSEHIDNMCKSAWFHLNNIRNIRKYLTTEATTTLIHAFVTSALDNLNVLLYKLPENELQRLQRIQNCAAKTITGGRKYDHVTPTLMKLTLAASA